MLLTNVGSWYFNDNVTYELISYFDLNRNLIERVSNTDCSSMGNSQTTGQIGYSIDPRDQTRYCGKLGGMISSGLMFYPIPYLPEYRTSGKTSWFKMPTTVINTSCPDTEYYSLVNKRLEFYFYSTYSKGLRDCYLINTMNANFANNVPPFTLGYDVMIKTVDNRYHKISILYNNSTNPTDSPQIYQSQANITYGQWHKMIIDFKYDANISGDGGYYCVFYIYDNSDNLLDTFSGPSITLDPSINTNSYGFRFFEQFPGAEMLYTNGRTYIKEVKLYQIIS